MAAKKIEVFYNGDYPNACRGTLIITVDGEEIYNKDHCCTSTGSVSFDENWQENVEIGILEWDDADIYSIEIRKAVENELKKQLVCCGGCV